MTDYTQYIKETEPEDLEEYDVLSDPEFKADCEADWIAYDNKTQELSFED